MPGQLFYVNTSIILRKFVSGYSTQFLQYILGKILFFEYPVKNYLSIQVSWTQYFHYGWVILHVLPKYGVRTSPPLRHRMTLDKTLTAVCLGSPGRCILITCDIYRRLWLVSVYGEFKWSSGGTLRQAGFCPELQLGIIVGKISGFWNCLRTALCTPRCPKGEIFFLSIYTVSSLYHVRKRKCLIYSQYWILILIQTNK
jgi:hypothetical protein